MITLGDNAPTQTFAATPLIDGEAQNIALSDFNGQAVILYFYPKDSTSGCTLESQNFRDLLPEFTANNAIILGASRDKLASHTRFQDAQSLPFPLLSDPEEVLCGLFDVIKQKNMYGKQVMGIERSTFLFDKHGILQQEWRKVKVKGHADAVLQAVKTLNA